MLCRRLRNITAQETDHLTSLLKQHPNPRKRHLKAILNVLVVWGVLLLFWVFLSGFLTYLSRFIPFISKVMAFQWLQVLVIFLTGVYAIFKTQRWLANWDNPYPLILQDIKAGKIEEQRYFVDDVCRFQEPEFGGYIYYLKISDDNVFVLYDYDSQKKQAKPLTIGEELSVSKAPNSALCLSHISSGKPVKISATYPLTIPPENWPLNNTILSVNWKNLPLTNATN